MDDIVKRAMAAWYRSGESIQPSDTGVREYNGKKYVILENVDGVLAVYRFKVDGFLKRLKRWPEAVESLPNGTATLVMKVVKEKQRVPTTINLNMRSKNKNNSELMSDNFKQAWNAFFDEIKNAKALKWPTTSREAAIKHIQVLLDVATIR